MESDCGGLSDASMGLLTTSCYNFVRPSVCIATSKYKGSIQVMKSLLFLLCLTTAPFVFGQQFQFPKAAVESDAALSKAISTLAGQVLAVYKDNDHDQYLNNLFQLQLTAGQYAEAEGTIRALRDLRTAGSYTDGSARLAPFDVYAKAKSTEAGGKLSFDAAFQQAFHELFDKLDNKPANQLLYWFSFDVEAAHNSLVAAMAR